ncbi:MAG TPA: maleylpyruvate isomerase N-terminal domain-containing protein [Jiangellales bacterium]|nr:maleylpyruvate isomerase N-terminal domain-containing protein [Jiangellales bacterium]
MTPLREAYLLAGESAVGLISDPMVEAAWLNESALPRLSVGGLAAHLAGQLVFVVRTLDDPVRPAEQVGLLDHYTRVRWIGADLDAEANVRIRDGGETEAAGGARAVARRAAESIRELRERLSAEPTHRIVRPPAGPWGLALDDFLVTRMMEIVVHSDDLACSIGVATPELPSSVIEPVLTLLTALAVRRHGATALVRALSRAERAPATIAAI